MIAIAAIYFVYKKCQNNVANIFMSIFVTFVLAGCELQSGKQVGMHSYAIQVTDANGDSVQLKQPAKRIVCLFEASLDDLYMLNAGQHVIAIPGKIYTSTALYQAYSILDPRIKTKQLAAPSQSDSTSSLESIISLKPDLVVLYANQPDSITLLRSMGIPIYAAQSENLQQTLKELSDLGTLTGQQQRAVQLIQFIQEELASIHATTQDHRVAKNGILCVVGRQNFSSSGRDSMPNSMMTLAGARNIIQSRIDQPNINPEHLIEWNPDAILLWNSDPQLIYQQPELRSLKAVKQQQVFNLSPSFYIIHIHRKYYWLPTSYIIGCIHRLWQIVVRNRINNVFSACSMVLHMRNHWHNLRKYLKRYVYI